MTVKFIRRIVANREQLSIDNGAFDFKLQVKYGVIMYIDVNRLDNDMIYNNFHHSNNCVSEQSISRDASRTLSRNERGQWQASGAIWQNNGSINNLFHFLCEHLSERKK